MGRRGVVLVGEKRMVDATAAALAFPDAAVEKAGTVLQQLLDCDDPKERRLAAERIRDERGLTRVVKPTEHRHIQVTVSADFEQAMQQSRVAANRVEHRAPRVSIPDTSDGWKA